MLDKLKYILNSIINSNFIDLHHIISSNDCDIIKNYCLSSTENREYTSFYLCLYYGAIEKNYEEAKKYLLMTHRENPNNKHIIQIFAQMYYNFSCNKDIAHTSLLDYIELKKENAKLQEQLNNSNNIVFL